jgi:hypothetical protein
MDRTVTTAHRSHDELLIARLYGGDADGAERDLALELVADCRQCAALYADLAAIADATAALPVPARPRDFSLSEADAARLRPAPRNPLALFGRGVRRSLGGALAAIGLVGVVATGASSFLASTPATFTSNGAAAPASSPAGLLSGSGYDQVGGPTPAATEVSVPDVAPTAAPTPAPAGSETAPEFGSGATAAPYTSMTGPSPAASGAKQILAANPSAVSQAGGTGSNRGLQPAGGTAWLDPRLAWFGGFALLFAIGLVVLLLPELIRRRRHAA